MWDALLRREDSLMARPRPPSPALEAIRDAAIADMDRALDEAPEEPVAPVSRKPRPVDPQIAVLFPSGVVQVHELLALANAAWREATMREAPPLERLATPGVTQRVDVDAASGYVAVVTDEDTYRAFVPRDQLATIVALLVRRPVDVVARELSTGPGAFKPEGAAGSDV